MTYPNGGPILEVMKTGRQYRPGMILLSEEYLSGFGEMRIPLDLWQTLRKHTIWVEPVVVSEWGKMIRRYAKRQEKELEESQIRQAMVWVEPGRDVQVPKQQALKLLEKRKLFCVWTGEHLGKASLLDVDHCLPWSVWSCGDLWNLMPALRKVNQNKKRDLLPSDAVMDKAEERILEWWDRAYYRTSWLQEQFLLEACSSLPGIRPDDSAPESVFESVCLQRAKLKRDQQAPEWDG